MRLLIAGNKHRLDLSSPIRRVLNPGQLEVLASGELASDSKACSVPVARMKVLRNAPFQALGIRGFSEVDDIR
jgi:hypothetical protein